MTESSTAVVDDTPLLKLDETQKQIDIKIIENTTQRIGHIVESKKELTLIQKNLDDLLHAMSENPSLLARAATFWGKVPLWQKIVGGVVLIAPTLIIGIAAQIAIFFAISIFTLIAYVSSSVVLDDHHSHNVDTTKNLRVGVLNLAEALETVIKSLEAISEQLTKHLADFEQENKRLNCTIDSLSNLNNTLTQEIDQLKITAKKLHHTEKALEKTCAKLQNSVAVQTALLEESQAALNQIKIDYEHNQKQLANKVSELDKVRAKLTLDIEQHKKIGQTLEATLNTLIETISADEAHRNAFKEKLDAFVTNKEASFTLIVDRICAAEKELTIVKDQLKLTTERYDALVNRAEGQINRLEQLPRSQYSKEKTSDGIQLKQVGLFSHTDPLIIQTTANPGVTLF